MTNLVPELGTNTLKNGILTKDVVCTCPTKILILASTIYIVCRMSCSTIILASYKIVNSSSSQIVYFFARGNFL